MVELFTLEKSYYFVIYANPAVEKIFLILDLKVCNPQLSHYFDL